MSELKTLLEQAEALYRDTTFASVRSWKESGKEAQPGRKAIGYLPVYVPRELIHAAGMLPVGITGHGDIEIIRGDAYFQSYICHLPRSVTELGVAGHLDCLDGVLFPSTCDVVRNLSGMWKLMFPERYARYFDVPQNFSGEVGGTFYRGELAAIRADFEKLSGNSISDEALKASIAAYNENRRVVEAMYAARRERPWLYPSSEVYLVLRAGHVLPVEEHTTMVRQYVELAGLREGQPLDHIRVVLSGAFCEQPPVELIQTLERSGCYIVEDDLLMVYRWFTEPVGDSGDPMTDLVAAFLTHSSAAASLYCARGDNGEDLVQRARRSNADGVIFGAPSFCDPALLDQPMQVAALEREAIPYTSFMYSENTGQFQVIREQAGTFADSIRLWGQA